MPITTVAVIIVACALGGLVHYGLARDVRSAAAFAVGLLVALLVVAAGPAVLTLGG